MLTGLLVGSHSNLLKIWENSVPCGALRLTGDCSPGEFAITRTVKEESLKIATKHTQVIFRVWQPEHGDKPPSAACRVNLPHFQLQRRKNYGKSKDDYAQHLFPGNARYDVEY